MTNKSGGHLRLKSPASFFLVLGFFLHPRRKDLRAPCTAGRRRSPSLPLSLARGGARARETPAMQPRSSRICTNEEGSGHKFMVWLIPRVFLGQGVHQVACQTDDGERQSSEAERGQLMEKEGRGCGRKGSKEKKIARGRIGVDNVCCPLLTDAHGKHTHMNVAAKTVLGH